MSDYRKLTQAELVDLALDRFGWDWKTWAFECPGCADVASFADFAAIGADEALCGQHCIGRHLDALQDKPRAAGSRGCTRAAYEIHGPWEVVMPADEHGPERSAWSFPLAEVSK